jgi:exodeoxyribonuclease VII large subunit
MIFFIPSIVHRYIPRHLTPRLPSVTIRRMLWSVSELNRYVRQTLDMDYRLQDLRVSGEISGFRAYPSGHWYFTLKDAAAQVSCVMWRSRAERQAFTPRDGDAVLALGRVTLYEARGQFQLDVAHLQPTGEGELYRQFAYLKAALEAEGLFDPERKRPLPLWPRRVAVVTSPAGAALRDILNIMRRRCPTIEVVLSPTAVQGEDAPPRIVAALQAAAGARPDVIIVARGGGSLEDLWCFNDERVARAIAAAPVPVISGVGHETDFTLADFAADVRAPTPSAAAELVMRDQKELQAEAAGLAVRLRDAAMAQLARRRWALAERQAQLRGLSPEAQVRGAQQHLDDLAARAGLAMHQRMRLERQRWLGLSQALHVISPLAVLERGYALVSGPDGSLVRTTAQAAPGLPLRVRVADGEFGATVDGKR